MFSSHGGHLTNAMYHHQSLRKIKLWIRKFDPNRVNYIQYAVTSTSFNIFGEGIYNKCIHAISYTLSKGRGQGKFAMSCTYSFSSLVENLKGLLLMLLVFLLCICIFWRKSIISLKLNIVSHIPGSKMERILYPWK